MDDHPQSRLLRCGHSRLQLEPDAGVVLWSAHDPDLPPLVTPDAPGSRLGFLDVGPRHAQPGLTELLAPCGVVQVRDLLVQADEAVGRAAPGVALVRAVRCLDGPLDLTHVVRLARTSAHVDVVWQSLNRIAFGYFAGRKVTVDGGEVIPRGGHVSARLRAEPGTWCVLTVAFDGHLPADPALATTLFADGSAPAGRSC